VLPPEVANSDAGTQLRFACGELRRLLSAGATCRSEDFLNALPSLASDTDRAVELICTEFRLRLQRGEQPNPTDWYARFPQWDERLRQELPAAHRRGATISGDATVPDAAPANRDDAGEPSLFAHYEVLAEIGHGGMGVVFRARDTRLGRDVALKRIYSGHLARRQERERFEREARAAAQLHHPHIIPVYEFGECQGQHYLTMLFAPGGSLADQVEHFRAPEKAVSLIEKVARAVHVAHEQGIIHRDLKPANVLLDEHGEPLVADFGLAKFVESTADLTETGQLLGTPAYMSPEQAQGHPAVVTPRSDVWSLGVILYQLLTGQRPFPGSVAREVTELVLTTEPLLPREVCPTLDRNLEAIVLRCLEKEPARRYSSAAALADDLARWRCGEPVGVQPVSWSGRLRRQLRRRKNTVLAVCGGVTVATLFVLTLLLALAWKGPTPSVVEPRGDSPRTPPSQAELPAYKPRVPSAGEIQLLGEIGPPRWHQWCGEPDRAPLNVAPEKPVLVSATDISLLELQKAPLPDHYRLRADIRQETSLVGWVGIYMGRQEQRTANGREQWYWAATFADQGMHRGRWHLAPCRSQREPSGQQRLDARGTGLDGGFPAWPQQQPGWHTVEVELSPDQVVVSLDDTNMGRLSRADMERLTRSLLNTDEAGRQAAGVAPGFSPAGGVGVYLSGSTAFIRNVYFEPLPAR
jgi:serine/threonine protein kinase